MWSDHPQTIPRKRNLHDVLNRNQYVVVPKRSVKIEVNIERLSYTVVLKVIKDPYRFINCGKSKECATRGIHKPRTNSRKGKTMGESVNMNIHAYCKKEIDKK